MKYNTAALIVAFVASATAAPAGVPDLLGGGSSLTKTLTDIPGTLGGLTGGLGKRDEPIVGDIVDKVKDITEGGAVKGRDVPLLGGHSGLLQGLGETLDSIEKIVPGLGGRSPAAN
ncbi:phosphoglycerate mutase family protein [Purpureocillium lavendulum]|uniref:Phosphoglycerate mutase family protein n=1 Tax=Purpureocillium lavendulum TaxID=1247861 RepID=A0AB34FHK5_9HYPO|nr:phosphoglycerate mutase family protein [Purpureocillium lavendulum]